MAIDDNVRSPYPRSDLRDVDGLRRRRDGLHLRGPFRRLRRDVQQPGPRQRRQPDLHEHVWSCRRRTGRATRTSSPIRSSARTEACTWLLTTSTTSPRAGTTTTTRCCWPSRPTAARASRRRCRSARTTTCPTATPTRVPEPIRDARACRRRARRRCRCSAPRTTRRARSIRTTANVVAVDVRLVHQQGLERVQRVRTDGLRRRRQSDVHGVKTAGACNNKILLSVSTNGGATFTGTGADPRTEELVTQSRGQSGTDQYWQWAAFTRNGKLAVDYYDRQYGNDETTGSSDFSLSGSDDLTNFGQVRVTSSSMPAPTQFGGHGRRPVLRRLRLAHGLRQGLPDLVGHPGKGSVPVSGQRDTRQSAEAVRRDGDERAGGERRGDVHGGRERADCSRTRARALVKASRGARPRPGPGPKPRSHVPDGRRSLHGVLGLGDASRAGPASC